MTANLDQRRQIEINDSKLKSEAKPSEAGEEKQ